MFEDKSYKPTICVGFIGPRHNGKTSFVSQLRQKYGEVNMYQFLDASLLSIEKSPQEISRSLIYKLPQEIQTKSSINSYFCIFETSTHHFVTVDIPGNRRRIKNCLKGIYASDSVVLVISMVDEYEDITSSDLNSDVPFKDDPKKVSIGCSYVVECTVVNNQILNIESDQMNTKLSRFVLVDHDFIFGYGLVTEILSTKKQKHSENSKLQFDFLDEKFLNDKNLFLDSIGKNAFALLFASEEIQNDKKIISTLLKNDIMNLQFMSKRVRNDRRFFEDELKHNINILRFASNDLRNDLNFIKFAVYYNPIALKYASEEIQNDYDLVLNCVSREGKTIKYASETLKYHPTIYKAALENNGFSIAFLPNLEISKNLALTIVKTYPEFLHILPSKLKLDEYVVVSILKKKGSLIKFFPRDSKTEKILLTALETDQYFFNFHLSDKFRNDLKFMIKAVQINGKAFQFASQELKQTKN
eukprot:gene4959-8553_t